MANLTTLFAQWNPSWETMPWKHWTSPAERFEVLASFVFGEFMGIGAALLYLIHAYKQGRSHLVVWALTFITGAVNDSIFMTLPFVDNFWQSQACIMMTPRMPLYIPCCYVVFMYSGVVAAWRFGLAPLAEACMAGVMGELYYSVYDITGNKFLWWTWHDTDAPIRARNFGAPVGSTVWVITFTAAFALLVRKFVLGPGDKSADDMASQPAKLFSGGSLIVATVSTPFMMVIMAVLQLVCGDTQGLPTNRSFYACAAIFLAIIIYGFSARKEAGGHENPPMASPSFDGAMKLFLYVHYFFHAFNMAYTDPERNISTGVHQTVGPCDVRALDLAGQERQVYLCTKDFSEDFTFQCGGKDMTPEHFTEWYTVCGTPHSNWTGLMAAQVIIGTIGTILYSAALTPSDKALRAAKRPKSKAA